MINHPIDFITQPKTKLILISSPLPCLKFGRPIATITRNISAVECHELQLHILCLHLQLLKNMLLISVDYVSLRVHSIISSVVVPLASKSRLQESLVEVGESGFGLEVRFFAVKKSTVKYNFASYV